MTEQAYGNMGKILRIDLTTGKTTTEDASPYYKEWLGGRCLSHHLLFKEVDVAKTDPLSPENMILISTGVLGGTTFPSSGRTHATFLSPHNTSDWGDSNCGWHFGPSMKRCGYDMLIITGKSPKPVMIQMENDSVTLVSAEDLWERGCNDTQAELLNQYGEESKVLCIGPAGENLITFANVRTEQTNSMGRCGLGAVFGSKNLKAVVARGKQTCKTL